MEEGAVKLPCMESSSLLPIITVDNSGTHEIPRKFWLLFEKFSMALRPFVSPLRELLYPLVASSPLRTTLESPVVRRIYLPAGLPVLSSLITLPSLLSDVWEGLLRAVPKKKTSYSKTRSRQLAGKALKDVTALNKCSGCGRVKRMHLLCPYCVQGNNSRQLWRMFAIG